MTTKYIFLTSEGYTYQPDSECSEPDIENLQVIGISEGNTSQMAFQNLIKNNGYLLKTTFDGMFCYELSKGFKDDINYFSLASEQK